MSHVLGVAAFQLGNPVSFFVLMEADDPSRDRRLRRCVGLRRLPHHSLNFTAREIIIALD